MHYAWQICLKDLRQRFHDRTAFIVAVIAPLALTALIGLSLTGTSSFSARLAVVDLDHTQLSRSFVDFVGRAPRPPLRGEIVVSQLNSRAAAETAINAHDADAAVVLNPGFEKAAQAGNSGSIEILAPSDSHFAVPMIDALVRDFVNRVAVRPGAVPIASVIPRSPGGLLRMVDFYAASMAVLFLTFAVLSGVRALQGEMDDRTILRLIASPAEPAAILAGKFGTPFGARTYPNGRNDCGNLTAIPGTKWGNPFLVAALTVTSVLMAIGLTGFLMSLAKGTRSKVRRWRRW